MSSGLSGLFQFDKTVVAMSSLPRSMDHIIIEDADGRRVLYPRGSDAGLRPRLAADSHVGQTPGPLTMCIVGISDGQNTILKIVFLFSKYF